MLVSVLLSIFGLSTMSEEVLAEDNTETSYMLILSRLWIRGMQEIPYRVRKGTQLAI